MTTMEDLTKTQIVLLTLLVSFITSIATGIITTSLLAQAPAGVTQTIDRVVERTVERVAPSTGTGGTTREITVIKEDDAVVASIEGATKATVRIKAPAGSDGVQHFYSLGVVLNKQGYVLTDRRDIIQNVTYTMIFPDGTALPAAVTKVKNGSNLVLFKLIADESKLRTLSTVDLSKSDPKLGQTVIAIQGKEKTSVAVGRIISLDGDTGMAATDINPNTETQGSPLLNLSGELVGLKTSSSDLSLPAGSYISASSIVKFVSEN